MTPSTCTKYDISTRRLDIEFIRFVKCKLRSGVQERAGAAALKQQLISRCAKPAAADHFTDRKCTGYLLENSSACIKNALATIHLGNRQNAAVRTTVLAPKN